MDAPRGPRLRGLLVGLVLLSVVGFFLVPLATFIMALGTGMTCSYGSAYLLCRPWNDVIILAPFAGFVVGVLTGGLLGWLALRRGRTTTVAVVVAWCIAFGSVLAPYALLELTQARVDEAAQAENRAEQRAKELAALPSRPGLDATLARLVALDARIRDEVGRAVPGLAWPVTFNRPRDCGLGTPAATLYASGETLGPAGRAAPISDAQWDAIEAAMRRAAEPYGFTGRPGSTDADGFYFYLDAPWAATVGVKSDGPSGVDAWMRTECLPITGGVALPPPPR